MKSKTQSMMLNNVPRKGKQKTVPVREQIYVTEYKKPPRPTLGYIILSAMFSTLIFLVVYFLYILPQPRDIMQFISIFILNLMAGFAGSLIARMFTMYWERMGKSGLFINKQIISALIYSLVVFFGLFAFITIRYIDPNTITLAEFLKYLISKEFLEIVAILLGLKIFINLGSNVMAGQLSFGGGK